MNYDHMHGRARAPSDANGYGSQESQGDARSPLAKVFRSVTGDRKVNKDGQQQKRRGPKPDSKPALTRRQELNRQAQRTHRERKELYIKNLEQEVLKLKELFGNTNRERDVVINENRRLKDILNAHGIPYEFATPSTSYNTTMPSYSGSTGGSMSGSYRQDAHTTTLSPSPINAQNPRMATPSTNAPSAAQLPNSRLDYDQLGIDFVLALERPCMEHQQYLVVRSHNPEGQPHHHPMERADDMEVEHMSGHALMATCPPMSHVMDKPGEPYPHKMPDMDKSALMKLLESSSLLPVEGGEVTPVRAWVMIMQSEKVGLMSQQDFAMVTADLLTKVRCYGFGAVCEEFEVHDSLERVFAAKETTPVENDMAQYYQQPQQIMAR